MKNVISCEDRDMDNMDEVDRLNFALAGIAAISTSALKDGLASPRGFVSSYPTKLIQDLEFWMDDLRKLEREIKAKRR